MRSLAYSNAPRARLQNKAALQPPRRMLATRTIQQPNLKSAGGSKPARGNQTQTTPPQVGHTHELPNLTAPGVTTRVVTLSLKPLVVEAIDPPHLYHSTCITPSPHCTTPSPAPPRPLPPEAAPWTSNTFCIILIFLSHQLEHCLTLFY